MSNRLYLTLLLLALTPTVLRAHLNHNATQKTDVTPVPASAQPPGKSEVAITIEGYAEISFLLKHFGCKPCRMCGATILIDVETIWFVANYTDFGSQFLEYIGRYVVRGTVRTIHYDLETAELARSLVSALAEFDITTSRIVDAYRFADSAGLHDHKILLKHGLYGCLDFIIQFRAFR